jgi:anti-sigma factor RsiW
MTCQEVRPLLSAYHDGEVGPLVDAGIREHIGNCPTCAAEVDALASLSQAVRLVPRITATDGQRRRIRASLPADRNAGSSVRALSLAFMAGIAATLVFMTLVLPRVASAPDSLASEIIDSHVAALMSGRTIDVLSSDRHTVKPWFVGKVAISPTPWDLASDGFPLIGGRLAVLEGTPTPVFVYRRRKHWIDLFVVSGKPGVSWSLQRQGYSLIGWANNGMEYFAVSDVDPGDLRAFVDRYRSSGSGG